MTIYGTIRFERQYIKGIVTKKWYQTVMEQFSDICDRIEAGESLEDQDWDKLRQVCEKAVDSFKTEEEN